MQTEDSSKKTLKEQESDSLTLWKGLVKFLSLKEEEDFETFLRTNSIFTYHDILLLYKKFIALDVNKNGYLDPHEIQQLEGLEENPLVPRIISIFDTDKNGSIDFVEFLTALSRFNPKESIENKLQIMFKIYDVDGDGFISNEDLYEILIQLTGSNFENVSLQQIVDGTMLEISGNPEGLITFEQYKEFIIKNNSKLLEKLSMDIS